MNRGFEMFLFMYVFNTLKLPGGGNYANARKHLFASDFREIN